MKTIRVLPTCLVTVLAFSGVRPISRAQGPATPSYLPAAETPVLMEKLEVGDRREATYESRRTVTAMKTDTALIDVPQAMTVITRELIDDQAMQGIGDVTRYVPGAGIAQGEGNRDTPVLRGQSTTADFFVDGLRDDVQYFRDLYSVDRVEVLKGPNAMIFGRGGSGGLINRLTKQANGVERREFTVQVGAWQQVRTTVDAGGNAAPGWAYRVTGLFEDARSYRDDVALRRYGITPTLAWRPTPTTTVRVGGEYFHDGRTADRGVPSFQGRPVATSAATFFGDPARSPVAATVHAGFVQVEQLLPGGGSLRSQTRFGRYEKSYQNVFPGAVNAAGTTVALSAYRNTTDRDNLLHQTDAVRSFDTGRVRHQVLAGFELGRQDTANLRLTGYFTSLSPTTTSVSVPLTAPRTSLPITFLPSATDADNDGLATTAAAYVQDQITVLPQVLAVAGVRWETFTIDFHNRRTATGLNQVDRLASPRFGLIIKPTAAVSLYAGTSRAYVPRAGEQLASLTASNRAFAPEAFVNAELGVKWDVRRDLAFTAAVYRLDRRNVVITDPADATRSLLVDGQQARGVELGLTGRLTQRWSVVGGYAYQDGTITTTQSATVIAGARLAQLPRHTFSLWHRFDFNRTWGAGFGTVHRGEIFAATDNAVRLPGFVRCDAAVFWRVSARLRAQLNVENLLDRAYFASAHSNNNLTPGSPRALRASVTTRF